MKVLKLNPNKPEKKLLKLASDMLKKDGLVIYPTDTLYGLGANALSPKAIRKIYDVKGRHFKKPLSIAFHSLKHARKYVNFNPLVLKIAKKFLPGPLTIVLPMKYRFPKELTSGSKMVGIRIPDNKISLELVKSSGFPIVATSANVSGKKDSVTVDRAMKQIGKKVDLILDGGECKLKKPSTVIEINGNKIIILRKGAIKSEILMKLSH